MLGIQYGPVRTRFLRF